MSHHQTPTDQNVSQLHTRPESQSPMPVQKRQRQRQYSRSHFQQQIPPQICSPFHLRMPDERISFASCLNSRPYIRCQIQIPEDNLDSSVVRRRRRTRTTFTNKQIVELEQHFLQVRYPTHSRLVELASKLALGTAQVKVWFKNRRRRHKLQVDQNNENAPVSPSREAVNTSLQPQSLNNNSGNSSGSGSSDCGSGTSSAAATPAMLTPSPSSTASAVGLNDFFRNDPFQSYYYANQIPDCTTSVAPLTPLTHFSSPAHLTATQLYAPTPLMTTTANSSTVANFFTPPPAVLQQQCHQQPTAQQPQPQPQSHLQPQQHCSQYGQGFQQKVIGSTTDTGGRDGEIERQTKFDFSFAKPYYTQLLTPVSTAVTGTPTTATTAQTATATVMPRRCQTPAPEPTVTTMTLPYNTEPPAPLLTEMSAYCDDYEPLTPLNNKSSGLQCGGSCSGSNSDGSSNISHNSSSASSSSDDFVDPMDDTTTKTLQIFGPSLASVNAVTTNSHNTSSSTSAKPEETLLIMEQCTDAFSKYTKLSCESHESNYQCTMDTIMHAYINHRSMGSSTQLAYCFN